VPLDSASRGPIRRRGAVARGLTLALACALVACDLVGCAQVPPPREEPSPLLSLDLPPVSLGRRLALSQVVIGEFDGRTESLRFEVDVSASRLAIVGLTHLGAPLFTLIDEAGDVRVEAYLGEAFPFDPRYLLTDFQLTYWPAPALRPALQTKGLTLEEAADGRTRRIVTGAGAPIVAISYPHTSDDGGEIVLKHYDHPYLLRIRTVTEKAGR